MDQTQLIKALVKVLREDIKKTLKEEIRNAVHEVLNEEVTPTAPKQKVNESYNFKSKDDGSWGEINLAQPKRQAPVISPDMLGYGDNFSEYSQPESFGGMMNEEYSSYMEAQEGTPSLQHKMAMAARRNPDAVSGVAKAMNRDYSQLVKRFNKG